MEHFSCHLLPQLNNHQNLTTYLLMFCASSCDLIIKFQRTSSCSVWLSSILKCFSFQQLHRLQVVITKGQNCWQGDILLQWPLTFWLFCCERFDCLSCFGFSGHTILSRAHRQPCVQALTHGWSTFSVDTHTQTHVCSFEHAKWHLFNILQNTEWF